MSDFINKIITVILVFLMLVVAPMLISYKTDDILARREILNDVEVFIDKVSDTASITKDDINKLYLDCNSHGLTVNVSVSRLIETSAFDEYNQEARINYFSIDDKDDIEFLTSINKGDIIKVTVEEVTVSHSRLALFRILGLDDGGLEFSLAGVVG
ncbi:MAG: hypothetical protein IJ593_00870 [Lachnospiraceae bacterium]|nr:hypothetical protein [Lachnospiraceae bacterium]